MHELTAWELSERAADYAVLATHATAAEIRDTFDQMADLYACLAAEQKAQDRRATRQ